MADKKSHGRSTAGVELTDDVLEQMAKEAEGGLDVGQDATSAGPAVNGVRAGRNPSGAARS